jgi:hypothetical protein
MFDVPNKHKLNHIEVTVKVPLVVNLCIVLHQEVVIVPHSAVRYPVGYEITTIQLHQSHHLLFEL